AAGGHRPYYRRLRSTQKSRRAKFYRALSFPQGEIAFFLRARDAAILSLFWLLGFGRCLQLHSKDRKHQLSRSDTTGRREDGNSSAATGLLRTGRSGRCKTTRNSARFARESLLVFRRIPAPSGRRAGARVSGRPWTERGHDSPLPHWLCSRFGILAPGSAARDGR